MIPQWRTCPAAPDTAQRDTPLVLKKEEQVAFGLLHPGQIKVSIRFQPNLSVQIILAPDQAVESLKEMIEEKTEIPIKDQRLFYGGAELQDARTLTFYRIANDSTIMLGKFSSSSMFMRLLCDTLATLIAPRLTQTTETQPQSVTQNEVQIFVRNLNGKTMTIMVSPSGPVEKLKELVFEKTGIPASEQRLLYGGKQLEDKRLLSDYGIVKESTLHLGSSFPCSSESTYMLLS